MYVYMPSRRSAFRNNALDARIADAPARYGLSFISFHLLLCSGKIHLPFEHSDDVLIGASSFLPGYFGFRLLRICANLS